MSSVRFYAGVYVLLLVLVTMKVLFFEFFAEDLALALTMLSAVIEAVLIAAYFQHLRWEPRSLTYLYLTSVFAVLLLAFAAAFSIT